jgi:EF-hand domain pair
MDHRNLSLVVAPNLLPCTKNDMASLWAVGKVNKFVEFLLKNWRVLFFTGAAVPSVVASTTSSSAKPPTPAPLPSPVVKQASMSDFGRNPSVSPDLAMPGEDADAASIRAAMDEALCMFSAYDKDGSGGIDRAEFTFFYTELREWLGMSSPRPHEIAAALSAMDHSRDGVVDWSEFSQWWLSITIR